MARWTNPVEWAGLRDGSRCPICAEGRPMDVIGEFETTWVTAPARIPATAYLCIVSKRHVVEPFELSAEDRRGFWEESLAVAAAVDTQFKPIKMNYEIHGNTIPHLHLHLVPRFEGDPFEGGPIDIRMHAHERLPEEFRELKRIMENLNLGKTV